VRCREVCALRALLVLVQGVRQPVDIDSWFLPGSGPERSLSAYLALQHPSLSPVLLDAECPAPWRSCSPRKSRSTTPSASPSHANAKPRSAVLASCSHPCRSSFSVSAWLLMRKEGAEYRTKTTLHSERLLRNSTFCPPCLHGTNSAFTG
jgi:hypothetical protein